VLEKYSDLNCWEWTLANIAWALPIAPTTLSCRALGNGNQRARVRFDAERLAKPGGRPYACGSPVNVVAGDIGELTDEGRLRIISTEPAAFAGLPLCVTREHIFEVSQRYAGDIEIGHKAVIQTSLWASQRIDEPRDRHVQQQALSFEWAAAKW
jgi:hypothetical protein